MDGPVDDLTVAVLDAATRLGVRVGIETWDLDGDALGVEQHLARLEFLAAMGGRSTIRTNRRQLDEMVEVAGPIRAWTSDADGPDTQHSI
jgi:hypothetical protein